MGIIWIWNKLKYSTKQIILSKLDQFRAIIVKLLLRIVFEFNPLFYNFPHESLC